MKLTIIGIEGKARSGKTTAADFILQYVTNRGEGYAFEEYPFGAGVKKMLLDMNPILGYEQTPVPGRGYETKVIEWRVADLIKAEALDDDDFVKSTFPEYRRMLQYVGTEVVRNVFEDYWVFEVVDKIRERVNEAARAGVTNLVVVIPDVRFRNEAHFVLGLNDTLDAWLDFNGPGGLEVDNYLLKVVRPTLTTGDTHASEGGSGLAPDVTITNAGTLADMQKKVDETMELWIGE